MRFGTLAGAAAGTVGFVYVVGGAVMWLRFWRSGLPADQALALVPRTDLLVVGMRVMILPALAAGLLFLLLAARRARRGEDARMSHATLGLLAVPAVILALVVPFAPGAFAWPVAAALLWLVWYRFMQSEHDRSALMRRLAVAAMLAAALVSIARQFDRPVKLPSATLTLAGEERPVVGVLVTASTSAVAVGFPEAGRLTRYPRDRVETVEIGPPLDRRSPQRSLLSMAFGGEAWAATPLELWCGGESYGWTDLGVMCDTQPRIASPLGDFEDGRASVRIECPPEADRGCSGYLTVTTAEPFALEALSRAAQVDIGRTIYQVERNTTLEVSLPVEREMRRCLGSADQPVPLQAVLSTDRAGLGELNGDDGQPVAIRFPARAAAADECGTRERAPTGGFEAGSNGGPAAGGNEEGNGSDGGSDQGGTEDGGTQDGGTDEGTTQTQAEDPPAVETLPAEPPDPDDSVTLPEDAATE